MSEIINEILNENEGDEQNKPSDCNADRGAALKQQVFNWFVIIFSVIMTAVAIITFFITLSNGYTDTAAGIVSTYVLCMLLAAPTIKVFLDKCTGVLLIWFNIVTIILIFAAILVTVIVIFFNFAGFIG